jgi:hypothetical protein
MITLERLEERPSVDRLMTLFRLDSVTGEHWGQRREQVKHLKLLQNLARGFLIFYLESGKPSY